MNAILKRLIQLQELDLKIWDRQQRSEGIPKELETMSQSLESDREALREALRCVDEDKKERRFMEGETESLREKLSKYKNQLMEVKTNKEYQAMLHEIENTEKEIAAKEDTILEQMMAIDAREELTRTEERMFKEKEKQITKHQEQLKISVSEATREIEALSQEKNEVEEEIPVELTSEYQKIASARKGLAIAEAKDQSCQACHVKLRPQLFAEIKTNLDIIKCENCSRILYFSE